MIIFEAYGTDQLYLTDFNSDFARTSSDDFIARYIKRLKAQEVVVGFDYKFGHHRTDADYLARNFLVMFMSLRSNKAMVKRFRQHVCVN
mgnify:CR=1 FL=1